MSSSSLVQGRLKIWSEPAERDLRVAKSVELAFWLAFLGNLGRAILHNNDLLRHVICRPMVDAAGCILIFQGAVTIVGGRRTTADNQKLYLLTFMVLAIAFFALVHGLVSGAFLPLWFEMGVMGFGTAFAVFLAGRPFVFEAAFRALRQQIIVANIFVAYFLLYWPKESRFDWYWTDTGNEAVGAIANRCFFALPFLIANYRRLTAVDMFVVGIGFAEYVALNLRGENRSAVVISFLIIPVLLIAITLRQRQSLRWIWKAALCAGVLGVVLFHSMSENEDFDNVMQRFGVTDVSTSKSSEIASNINLTVWDNFAGNGPRGEEFRELLSDTSFDQFLFGRGFAVGWYAPIWAVKTHEWYMVHFGPGYMLLVGGLPLAICFTALLGLAIWKAWVNVNRIPSAAGALVFLSAAAVNYLQHGVLLDEPEFYFLWLCIGFSVGAPKLYHLNHSSIGADIRHAPAL